MALMTCMRFQADSSRLYDTSTAGHSEVGDTEIRNGTYIIFEPVLRPMYNIVGLTLPCGLNSKSRYPPTCTPNTYNSLACVNSFSFPVINKEKKMLIIVGFVTWGMSSDSSFILLTWFKFVGGTDK